MLSVKFPTRKRNEHLTAKGARRRIITYSTPWILLRDCTNRSSIKQTIGQCVLWITQTKALLIKALIMFLETDKPGKFHLSLTGAIKIIWKDFNINHPQHCHMAAVV